MSSDIKESDWEIFRELRGKALERFCQRVLTNIYEIRTDSTKSFHERYLDIYNTFHEWDRIMAPIFDDPRRSIALSQISYMMSRDLLTEEEFERFSNQTREIVERFLSFKDR